MVLCISLSHIANCRKKAKYIYFSLIVYDIWTYQNHSQDQSRKTTQEKQTDSAEHEGNKCNEEQGGSRNALNTEWQPSFSQEESSGFINM